jgi:hypothetical protein
MSSAVISKQGDRYLRDCSERPARLRPDNSTAAGPRACGTKFTSFFLANSPCWVFNLNAFLTDAFASGKGMVMTAAPDMRESN